MADNIEKHDKTGITVKTKGLKEFHYTQEDLKRIRAQDSPFKESLALWYYIKNPQDIQTKTQLKKYMKFFKVKYKVFNKKKEPTKKFHVDINIRYKKTKSYRYISLLSFDCSENLQTELPTSKYRIIFSRRRFILFKKKLVEEIDLTKNMSKEIIL